MKTGGHKAAAAVVQDTLAVLAVLAMLTVDMAGVVVADGNIGGVIETDEVGAMQINSSDPLTQPVLLNGQDVLSIIKEQASINAEQASIIQELRQVNTNLTLRITSLEQDVCRLQSPNLDWIQGAGSATYKWADGVLAPNGLIYGVPFTSTSVLIISPTTNALDTTTIAGLPSDIFKWWGGVLAPSNNNI